ncbi:MAG: hypothetical protein HZA54_04570 [Planctomycetes bacterium]|nr:hypothetical protein [Planctomycetota bacterium]
MKLWFYRLTALHFLLTAATGMALYFRPGRARPGWYSIEVKEWLVMFHNGEWLSYVAFGKPVFSGVLVGSALATALILHARRALAGPPAPAIKSFPSAPAGG